ncbi:MAG: helix-turn-helix domain-containing protein [Pseudomonadota bacterium]
MDFAQLEGGPCGIEVFSVRHEPFRFAQWCVEKRVRHLGVAPLGRVGLALHAASDLTLNSHGELFGEDVIVLIPGGSPIDSVAFAQTNLFGLSVDEDAFATMAKATGCPLAVPIQGQIRLLSPSREALGRLRGTLWRTREAALTGRCGQAQWDAVAGNLAACLASLDTPGRVPEESSRRRVVRRSLGYIGENLASPLTLSDICRTAGVSERTLIYAFKEHLGLTPKAYMNISRLNMVRREMECGQAPSITDAATRWGFWHMGQFSADYKRFFGELPSKTLSRARGRGLGPAQGVSG